MRILFVLPYVPSRIRVRPYHFVLELARRHDVSVLATGGPSELDAAEQLRDFCESVDVVPLRLLKSLRNCAFASVRGQPLQAAFCRSPELERKLVALLMGPRFDVVHVEHLRAAYARDFIPFGIPTLFDAVDCISLLQQRTLEASHSVRQRALAALELHRTRRYEARQLLRFDAVTATSPEDARALERLTARARVAVVPNGVDLEYFSPLAGPREPATLVLSGKMSYHANVTAVLHFVREILPLIREDFPDTRLRIVGSNPPETVRLLSRDPAIAVTGHLADIREPLGRATVAVCPVTVKVGVQNKILEAMAMSVPVVSSRLGAEGLLAEHGHDLLVASNPAEFARHVRRLLADPVLAARIGQAGRLYVERHHRWGSAVSALEQLYSAVRAYSANSPQPAKRVRSMGESPRWV